MKDKQMMVTSPEGHKCRLTISMSDEGTSVSVTHGDLRVEKSSSLQGDIDLVHQAMTSMDDMMMNIADMKPHIEEVEW